MNGVALVIVMAAVIGAVGVGLLILGMTISARQSRLDRRYHGERVRPSAAEARGREAWLYRMAEGGERIDTLLSNPQAIHLLLAQAGWRDRQARLRFHAFQFGLPAVVVLLSLPLWLVGEFESPLMGGLMALAAIILALLAPRAVLRWRAAKRREQIRNEVPLFINLLILLFEAGLNLRQALTSLARDGQPTMPALVSELQPLLRQMESGADADQLLFDLGKMLDIDELHTVLGILRQVERYGGEIREPLANALAALQERRGMELRGQVSVLSGKMTIVLVTCFFPPLLIFIAGPAFMSISRALGGL